LHRRFEMLDGDYVLLARQPLRRHRSCDQDRQFTRHCRPSCA
jgi:hypothetical protein